MRYRSTFRGGKTTRCRTPGSRDEQRGEETQSQRTAQSAKVAKTAELYHSQEISYVQFLVIASHPLEASIPSDATAFVICTIRDTCKLSLLAVEFPCFLYDNLSAGVTLYFLLVLQLVFS